MRRVDLICSMGGALLFYLHHALMSGWGTPFELHPAIVVVFLFFAVCGLYKMVFENE